ncbi:TetR/AcrR family transcriptional regulator [Cognataquiflexum rubidum]|uniref:TetR/AcrR family transcriptional regulator n=1 Tax=Cognataquiflexum rubidum TaxID=2922273 RepID=UPI001F138FF1|nr:TetR/AcrR family transcriptional regulator [Cognataquiflexum rubidum]MCH6235006.1 TetR/AcrR family transcriptional regulator [Cognataquiflexum rubidum]
MSKINSEHTWIDAGYSQFGAEGLEGLQVERLSRITGLNKSGYYHYFGDKETFLEKLMENHQTLASIFAEDLRQIKEFDPEFMEVLIKHTPKLMFHNQLVRNREEKILEKCYNLVNDIIDPIASKLFGNFIGLKDNNAFSFRYFQQVRDTFYSQITLKRMNYLFLRDFMYEARDVIQRALELGSERKKM